MSRLPPLRALQIFETVGHCGGISQAAKRLNLSVGAVSQQMKLLDEALGMSLTVKDGQRFAPECHWPAFPCPMFDSL